MKKQQVKLRTHSQAVRTFAKHHKRATFETYAAMIASVTEEPQEVFPKLHVHSRLHLS